MIIHRLSAVVLIVVSATFVFAQTRPAVPAGPRGSQVPPGFKTDVPAHEVDIVLGRPTSNSVTLSILFYRDARVSLVHGPDGSPLTAKTSDRAYKAGEPVEIVLDGLRPDTQYVYELRGGHPEKSIAAGRFHTQRPPGSTFTFTIQADSHLDERTLPAIYQQTLTNVTADKPDFHIDLGDTFMTEKHEKREDAARQYLAQRYYVGQSASLAPLFLVLGNHDGEGCRHYDGTLDCLAVWSNTMRKRYFPNPVPDVFYTGNTTKDKTAGLLQNYYAWTWGDALFVVLDPYWHSARPRGHDGNWTRSLGDEQYRWLVKTLEQSRSKYKFVFVHHFVGGLDNQGRGGAEAALFYEWGGKNADGSDGFRSRRPGWAMSIHDLLVRHKVTAVFHGHDHFYARQELDGIIYQLVPQPGNPGPDRIRIAAEYGYKSGDIIGGAGHLRVTVAPKSLSVDYVRSVPPSNATAQRGNGQVIQRWTLPASTTQRGQPLIEPRILGTTHRNHVVTLAHRCFITRSPQFPNAAKNARVISARLCFYPPLEHDALPTKVA